MADNIVETIFVKLGLDGAQFNSGADKAIKKNDTLNKSILQTDKVTSKVGKAMARWFAGIASATGLARLIDQVQQLNDELYHLEKNLGMSATTIKAWQGAAGAMGGSAEGVTSSVKSLNMQMNDFVIMGDTSLLPFMNALGVSMVDAQGKLRETDQVVLDLADSFSKMDREQALSLSQKMGIDEGTFNTLVQGRQEMEKMIEYQKTMYQSSEKELQASRELSKNRALLGQHWESLKTMLANVLIPVFVKLSEVALGIFEYLQKHQKTVQAVFTGLAFVIGMVLTPILVKATIAALALMAPFLPFIATVTALGAAFGLLYDDYKAWAEGGNSLFNWGAFATYIDNAKFSTDNLKNSFAYLLTGYKDWASAAEGGKEWLKLKGFIEDNNVSVGSLTNGFKNLARELMSDVIPTLKSYGSILSKLFSGDFRGAVSEAKEMGLEYWKRATASGNALGERIRGAFDIATGQEVGTAAGVSVMNDNGGNKGGTVKQKYSSKSFTADKAKSIARVAKNIGVNPNDLAAVISFETGGTFSPSIKNPKSSATGLIQFMSGSGGTKGKYYGMSREKFASLSFDEQMNYVEKYFKERDKRFRAGNESKNTVADVYTAVTGYGYKKGSRAYDLNKVWDSNKDGYIAKGEMVQNKQFKAHQRKYFDAQTSMRQGTSLPPTIAKPQGGSTVRNDVNVQNVTINTSASTMSGTGEDMARGIGNQVGMLLPAAQ